MKIPIFSDLHIHNYKKFDNKGSRLNHCLEALTEILTYSAETLKSDFTLFGGDLYDSQKTIPTIVVNKTIKTLSNFFKKHPKHQLIAISGNHDYATKNLIGQEEDNVTALEHLKEVFPNNFILIDNSYVDIAVKDDGTVRIHGIPYYEFKEHFDEALNNTQSRLKVTGDNILLIHQTPVNSNPNIPYDVNPLEDKRFLLFDHTFCGHIHKREEVTDNFMIVGSPIHRDLADEGQQKGFIVYDSIKRKYGFIHLHKYPEFKISAQVDLESEDYIIPLITNEDIPEEQIIESAKFSNSLKPQELLENFWKSKDGKDKELLKMGFSLI